MWMAARNACERAGERALLLCAACVLVRGTCMCNGRSGVRAQTPLPDLGLLGLGRGGGPTCLAEFCSVLRPPGVGSRLGQLTQTER